MWINWAENPKPEKSIERPASFLISRAKPSWLLLVAQSSWLSEKLCPYPRKKSFLFGAISDKSKGLLLVLNSVTILVVIGETPKLGCWKSNQSWSSNKQAPYLMYVLFFLPSRNIFIAPFLQGFPCTIRLVTVVAPLHTEPQLYNSI